MTSVHSDDGELLAMSRDELPETRRTELERHLLGCADCRALSLALAEGPPASFERWAEQAWLRPSSARRKRIPPAVAVAAAAAAIFFVAIQRSAEQSTIDRYVLTGPLGGVAELRGADPRTRVFTRESRIKLYLAPERALETAPALSVFVERHGRLFGAPAGTVSKSTAGAYAIENSGAALFGDEGGTRTLHLALGARADAIGDGHTRKELEEELEAHRWLEVELEYRPELAEGGR